MDLSCNTRRLHDVENYASHTENVLNKRQRTIERKKKKLTPGSKWHNYKPLRSNPGVEDVAEEDMMAVSSVEHLTTGSKTVQSKGKALKTEINEASD